eukprot:GHVL01007286.1.p1 GENE.GHVL01007286.1~~GHVL01007286.1.p1  ORF type:complete len:294 (+),score=41.98 GHVL01007286.1:1239-2120(+)
MAKKIKEKIDDVDVFVGYLKGHVKRGQQNRLLLYTFMSSVGYIFLLKYPSKEVPPELMSYFRYLPYVFFSLLPLVFGVDVGKTSNKHYHYIISVGVAVRAIAEIVFQTGKNHEIAYIFHFLAVLVHVVAVALDAVKIPLNIIGAAAVTGAPMLWGLMFLLELLQNKSVVPYILIYATLLWIFITFAAARFGSANSSRKSKIFVFMGCCSYVACDFLKCYRLWTWMGRFKDSHIFISTAQLLSICLMCIGTVGYNLDGERIYQEQMDRDDAKKKEISTVDSKVKVNNEISKKID